MSFSFTVEDGSIVLGANSYVSLDFANDYISQNAFAQTLWGVLADNDKQLLLAWATRYLDQRATWAGTPTSFSLATADTVNLVAGFDLGNTNTIPTTQALRWPRTYASDVDGVPVPYNVIPYQLQQATCEMARYLITTDRSTERPQDGLKELKLDVMTLIFRENYVLPVVPSEISFIIRGIGQIGSGSTGFAKITRV